MLFNDDDIRLFRSLKSNSLVMNAIIIPNVVDKMNDCIQFNELFFRIKHVMLVNAINDMIKQNNIEGIILGCTEIEMLIKPNDLSIPIFDTTQAHIDCIVNYTLERL